MRAIVDDYIREYRVRAKAEMLYYKRQPTLAEVVDIAARCVLPNGKRHPHRRRIPPKSIAEARSRLLAVDLGACRSFDELHTTINATIRDIYKVGGRHRGRRLSRRVLPVRPFQGISPCLLNAACCWRERDAGWLGIDL